MLKRRRFFSAKAKFPLPQSRMFGERECGRPVEWQPGVEMVVLGAAVKSRGGVEVCGAALGGGPCLDSAAGRDA